LISVKAILLIPHCQENPRCYGLLAPVPQTDTGGRSEYGEGDRENPR